METWMWISLWIVQTFVGAVLWRKLVFNKEQDYSVNINLLSFLFSAILIPNIAMLFAFIFGWLNKVERL